MTKNVASILKDKEMKRTRLIVERKSKKLKQSDVAKILGVTTRQYQRLESGEIQGKIEHWDMLEDLFEIPQRQLRETNKFNQIETNPSPK